MFKQNFKIINLTCEACVKLSTMALKKLPGVQSVNIDLASGSTEVESADELNWEDVKNALAKFDKVAQI